MRQSKLRTGKGAVNHDDKKRSKHHTRLAKHHDGQGGAKVSNECIKWPLARKLEKQRPVVGVGREIRMPRESPTLATKSLRGSQWL